MADGTRTTDRRLRADSLGHGSSPVSSCGWASPGSAGCCGRTDPPRAGFDLALLLEGARRVLAGETPYDPAMLAGASPDAVELFYSYPPPVAQAMRSSPWLPDGVVLVLWGVGATLGFGVGRRRRLAVWSGYPPLPDGGAGRSPSRRWCCRSRSRSCSATSTPGIRSLYGALLLAALPGATPPDAARGRCRGRDHLDRQAPPGAAAACGSRCAPGASAAGPGAACSSRPSSPDWRSSRSASSSAASSRGSTTCRSCEPARAPASSTPATSARSRSSGRPPARRPALRWIQVAVVAAAAVATVFAAVRVRDPILSVGIVVTASLVVLPVTWYHYPVALMPVAAALAIRDPRSRPWVAAALVLVDVGDPVPAARLGRGRVVLFAAWRAQGRGAKPPRRREPATASHRADG